MEAHELLSGLGDHSAREGLILVAFAAGDAFGVPYEFLDAPRPVDPTTIGTVDGWPAGGVSDDTTLTLLTLESLGSDGPDAAAARFTRGLREAASHLRGLGPTTKAALGMEVKESERHLIGRSNGALMRTSLVGLAFTPEAAAERAAHVNALARTTHSADAAIVAAQLAAAVFSRTMAGEVRAADLVDLALSTIACEPSVRGLEPWSETLRSWGPPPGGVTLDPLGTLAAVLWTAARSDSAQSAYVAACELGGDTDTVGALAGALVTACSPTPCDILDVPWIDQVDWSDTLSLPVVARRVAHMRVAQ